MATVGIDTGQAPSCHWAHGTSAKTNVYKLNVAYRTSLAYQYKPCCRWAQRKSLKTKVYKLSITLAYQYRPLSAKKIFSLKNKEKRKRRKRKKKKKRISSHSVLRMELRWHISMSCRWAQIKSLQTNKNKSSQTPYLIWNSVGISIQILLSWSTQDLSKNKSSQTQCRLWPPLAYQ